MNYYIRQFTQSNRYRQIVSTAFLTFLTIFVASFEFFCITGIAVIIGKESFGGTPPHLLMDRCLPVMALSGSGVLVSFMFVILAVALVPSTNLPIDYAVNWKRDGF